jgi:hypothetical protein
MPGTRPGMTSMGICSASSERFELHRCPFCNRGLSGEEPMTPGPRSGTAPGVSSRRRLPALLLKGFDVGGG